MVWFLLQNIVSVKSAAQQPSRINFDKPKLMLGFIVYCRSCHLWVNYVWFITAAYQTSHYPH